MPIKSLSEDGEFLTTEEEISEFVYDIGAANYTDRYKDYLVRLHAAYMLALYQLETLSEFAGEIKYQLKECKDEIPKPTDSKLNADWMR